MNMNFQDGSNLPVQESGESLFKKQLSNLGRPTMSTSVPFCFFQFASPTSLYYYRTKAQSLLFFMFMNKDNAWLKPVMLFYAKTTSWIVFPLVLAIVLGKYIGEENRALLLILGFGATCFGLYREIKQYKKELEKK